MVLSDNKIICPMPVAGFSAGAHTFQRRAPRITKFSCIGLLPVFPLDHGGSFSCIFGVLHASRKGSITLREIVLNLTPFCLKLFYICALLILKYVKNLTYNEMPVALYTNLFFESVLSVVLVILSLI